MIKYLFISIVLFGCVSLASNPQNGNASDEYFAMTEDFIPFSYEEGGEVRGYSTEVVREIFKRANMKVSFTLWPWARSYNAALSRKNHFVYSTSRTPEREKLFKWVGPIVKDSVYLAALEGSPIKPVADFRDLKKLSVSGQFDDWPVQVLQKNGFKVIIYHSEDARMTAFSKGRIDLDILTTGSERTQEKKWNIKYKRVAFMYDTDYWMAFNKATPDSVIKQLNSILMTMKSDGTLKKVSEKYIDESEK